MVIRCKDKAELIRYQVKCKLADAVSIGAPLPRFTIIQVGADPASDVYVKGKIKDCEFAGIGVRHVKLAEDISTKQLCSVIEVEQEETDAIIVQLPLPEHINRDLVLDHINPDKDVDGLTRDSCFKPCTPLAVMCVLKDILELDLTDKRVVMIGRSQLVGMPLFNMLQAENANVTLLHSKTGKHNLRKYCNDAEIIVSAVGKINVLDKDEIPAGTFVIDVGINKGHNGKLYGDIYESFHYYKTPVPGGIGLLTRAMLLQNIFEAYDRQNEKYLP